MNQVKTIFAIVTIIMIGGACGSSKKAASDEKEFPKQFATNIKVDGDPSEWKDIPALYQKEAKSFYTVANDEQAIYLLLKISDQAQQMKVVRSGMDIWFDLKGKKTKQIAVKYPLPSEISIVSMRDSRDGERRDIKEIMKGLLFLKNEMALEGFKDGMNGKQPLLAATSGIKIATSITTDGTLIYELVVPFTAFSTSLFFQMPVSVGIVMKAMEQNAAGGSPGGGRPGGGPPGGACGATDRAGAAGHILVKCKTCLKKIVFGINSHWPPNNLSMKFLIVLLLFINIQQGVCRIQHPIPILLAVRHAFSCPQVL